ncbi:MAG: M23 family metallopeptidase [Rickettsiales bacterium]|nr:M23 family metallopeptidase [Rickettsiales bacterium]
MEFSSTLYKFFTLIILLALAASCSQKPAKIVNNYDAFYSKSKSRGSSNSNSLATIQKTSGMEIEVRPGDNLYNIAKQYHTTIYEIIEKNNLKPPYILHVGQKMLIPLPSYHTVVHGDSVYTISRDYNMNMDKLIRLNKLKKPYSIYTGQKLRIGKTSSSVTRSRSSKQSSNDDAVLTRNIRSSGKFIWPVRGKIISTFGAKKGGLYNDGINIKVAKGTKVKAADSGVVAYVGNELKGYGNLIIIKHSSKWITAYAHLDSLSVKRGQKVEKGDIIASVGSSGNVDSPQLYFGLRKGRDALDPQKHIK